MEMLGQGVYTISEAVEYTKVPAATLRSWFLPRGDGQGKGPIFTPDWDRVKGDFALSFVNLIEALAAATFKKNKVSPTDIRKTNELLKKELSTPHPFAHADLSAFLRRIILENGQPGIDRRYQDVINKQLIFPEFRLALQTVDYSSTSRLAQNWRISEGVVINPQLGFGHPVIDKTGISTLLVARQYVANSRNVPFVAKLFHITESGVKSAVQFESGLGRIAA